MKTTINIILLAFATVSISLHAGTTPFPAPLPKFMNQEQLTKWRAERVAAVQTASSTQETPTQFYTGKPYVADAGGYIFKYRTYNPEMSRWTSADPSGFPDGANDFCYVNNNVIMSLDPDGYASLTYSFIGTASFTVPGTGTTLNPSATGTFTATTDATGENFTASGGSWTQGLQGSTQWQAAAPSKESYTFNESSFKQTGSGTTSPNAQGLMENYVTVTAYFSLTSVVLDSNGDGGFTTTTTLDVAGAYTFYGTPYE